MWPPDISPIIDSPAYQAYIRLPPKECARRRGSVDHASAGALELQGRGLLALTRAAAGHHGGLPDFGQPNDRPKNIPFTLGCLFSVPETIQQAANPGINATIKDKYFNSASSIPATIFPQLVNLAQKHLRKLKSSNYGLFVTYDKQLTELCGLVGDAYPARLTLPEQGSFQLGYYHQTQLRYRGSKKEEN